MECSDLSKEIVKLKELSQFEQGLIIYKRDGNSEEEKLLKSKDFLDFNEQVQVFETMHEEELLWDDDKFIKIIVIHNLQNEMNKVKMENKVLKNELLKEKIKKQSHKVSKQPKCNKTVPKKMGYNADKKKESTESVLC